MDFTINSAMGIAGQTAASLYANVPVKLVLLAAAVLFCFAGYKLLRWVSALCGVVLGVVLGICATSLLRASMAQTANLVLTVLVMVAFGILFGVLCFRLYRLGFFLGCACIGAAVAYVPALFVAQPAAVEFWAILAVCAALFGVTGVLLLRPAGILTTSLFGFAVSAVWTEMAGGRTWVAIAAGVGVTAAGCVVQLLTNRNTDILPADRGGQSSPAVAQTKPDAATDSRATVPEEADDSTQVLDMSALPQEEPDEADWISDAVAAQIGMAATAPLHMGEAVGTEPLWPDVQQEAIRPDVPLEQQAEFAWLIEEPVEAPGQDEPDAHDTPDETPEPDAQTVVQPVAERTEMEPLEPVKAGKTRTKRMLWPVLLAVVALVFAAVGIQYVEIALALCFVCYVLRYYRTTAFACAVLCMRRAVDVVLFVRQNGSWVSIGLDIVSAVIFLALTFAAIQAYSRTRHASEHENEE